MPNALPAISRLLSVPALTGMLALTACGGGGGIGDIINNLPTPTPAPPSTLACPTSGSLPTSAAVGTQSQSTRRAVPSAPAGPQYVPGQLAVTYASGMTPETIERETAQFHSARIADIAYHDSGLHQRIVSVDPASTGAAMARIRALPGVKDVARVTYRHRMAIAVNDPYYVGFTGTTAPYFESASIPGQWDMHAIGLDGAWSQFASAPVIGAPIAIVDTGVDVTHTELVTPSGVTVPKVIRTQCYVTYPSSAPQSSGPYVTDSDGHGTNVAGLADGDTNNNYAFAGVAFDAPLLAYRIFPTEPSGGCPSGTTDPQCEATSADEASAIDDAVSHGAKVINLSLGASPPCPTNDPEYVAVEYAISHGVVVVAAAGNETSGSLDCPAADPGVIAAGATGLDDSNPLSIVERVASYSNYLPTKGTSSGGAFLVAPGGDPSGGTDTDDLHWIEHIYAATAAQPGDCGKDFANESGNCRILIAGTSQATPHIVGVVSLMLAKKPSLSPAQVAAGLCASADDISDTKQGCGRVNASAAVTWAATH